MQKLQVYFRSRVRIIETRSLWSGIVCLSLNIHGRVVKANWRVFGAISSHPEPF
jgi:hypothetical protein